MADKSVGELIAAQSVTPTDLFVLEQNGTAKKLTGQVLENWLVSFADGHGGIQNIEKVKTSGFVDTYRITLADTTTFDFVVTNGRGISSLKKTGTSGLVDTYTFTYNDETTSTFTVTNGAKGDKGDNAYIWVKFASQRPTASSNSFGDVPDDWIGIYFGGLAEAPNDWQEYIWYKIKGEKGDTGNPATLISATVTYQAGDTGTIIPSGAWTESIPMVAQGKYLWTKIVQQFNTGSPITSYTVSRMGLDGLGSVVSVAGVSPDESGNVPLTAINIRALSISGGDMEGPINMNGQNLSGLNAPTANDHAANMGFVNQQVKKAAPWSLLDNGNFRNPVNQRGQSEYSNANYTIDRWKWTYAAPTRICTLNSEGLHLTNNSASTAYFAQRFLSPLENVPYTIAIQQNGTIYTHVARTFGSSDVLTLDGSTLYLESNLSSFNIAVPSNSAINSIEWIALYKGEYTVDTLPEYQPKVYGAELAECQRYFVPFRNGDEIGIAYKIEVNNGGTRCIACVMVPVPVTMYDTPSVVGKLVSGDKTATVSNVKHYVGHLIVTCDVETSDGSIDETIKAAADGGFSCELV